MKDNSTSYPSTYIQDQQDTTVWMSDNDTIEDSDQVDQLIALFDNNQEL